MDGKKLFVTPVLLVLMTSPLFAQTAPAVTPSTDSIIKSISEGTAESTDDSINAIMTSITSSVSTGPVTQETVKSAIEGPLTVNTASVPEVNQEAAETVNKKTGRYPPRIRLDFDEFPLYQVSGNTNEGSGVQHETGKQIEKRLRERLREPDIQLSFQDRTVTLTGSVKTARQHFLAEWMLRVEPGVDKAVNNLTVISSGTSRK